MCTRVVRMPLGSKVPDAPEAGGAGTCELTGTVAGNRTRVLWESSTSSQALSLPSNHQKVDSFIRR